MKTFNRSIPQNYSYYSINFCKIKQIFSNFSNLIALFIQNTKEQKRGQITSVPDLTSQTLIRTQLLFSRPDLEKPFYLACSKLNISGSISPIK